MHVTPSPHILVVDDEPFILELLQEVLSLHGYQVTTAGTLTEAQKAIQQQPFDLVLSDVFLPDNQKTALPHALDASSLYAGIPVIFMTGYQPPPRRSTTQVLIKPFSVENLLRAIQQEVSNPKH